MGFDPFFPLIVLDATTAEGVFAFFGLGTRDGVGCDANEASIDKIFACNASVCEMGTSSSSLESIAGIGIAVNSLIGFNKRFRIAHLKGHREAHQMELLFLSPYLAFVPSLVCVRCRPH